MNAGLMSRVASQPPSPMAHFVFDKPLAQFLERRQQLKSVPLALTDETVLTGDSWPLREVDAEDVAVEMAYSKEPR